MEITIAICDDEEIFVKEISEYVNSAAKKLGSDCVLIGCKSGNELVEIYNTRQIDAVFLDIAMPDQGGFETAEKLLKIRKKTVLVFVSSKEKMVFSSYEYSPFWFVPKSNMQLLAMVSERVVKKVFSNRQEILSAAVEIEHRIFEINFKDVAYFKTEDHYVKFVSKDGKASCSYRDKLDNIEVQLRERWFVRCHNRFLVNCRMISYIENYVCTLLNAEQIPISRTKLSGTKDAFQNYLRSTR